MTQGPAALFRGVRFTAGCKSTRAFDGLAHCSAFASSWPSALFGCLRRIGLRRAQRLYSTPSVAIIPMYVFLVTYLHALSLDYLACALVYETRPAERCHVTCRQRKETQFCVQARGAVSPCGRDLWSSAGCCILRRMCAFTLVGGCQRVASQGKNLSGVPEQEQRSFLTQQVLERVSEIVRSQPSMTELKPHEASLMVNALGALPASGLFVCGIPSDPVTPRLITSCRVAHVITLKHWSLEQGRMLATPLSALLSLAESRPYPWVERLGSRGVGV